MYISEKRNMLNNTETGGYSFNFIRCNVWCGVHYQEFMESVGWLPPWSLLIFDNGHLGDHYPTYTMATCQKTPIKKNTLM